jgi:hypothetical protein
MGARSGPTGRAPMQQFNLVQCMTMHIVSVKGRVIDCAPRHPARRERPSCRAAEQRDELTPVAVGTRVASRPPRRSGRAAFPHTAPTKAPVTRLSGPASRTCFAGPHSSWSPPLAPPAPQRMARLWIAPQQSATLCSSAFYYGGVRLLVPVHHRLRLLAFPMRQERGVEAARIRCFHEIELQSQCRCPAACLPDGDGAVRVARIGQHRDARKTRKQFLEQLQPGPGNAEFPPDAMIENDCRGAVAAVFAGESHGLVSAGPGFPSPAVALALKREAKETENQLEQIARGRAVSIRTGCVGRRTVLPNLAWITAKMVSIWQRRDMPVGRPSVPSRCAPPHDQKGGQRRMPSWHDLRVASR